ncbi:MAG: tRNA 2-thiouridine(34) synthase MnmA [Geminicoccaceae bacterium]|nr:tRNA 2-thiouridine(34) synthase MnmA [Geminicoccaceae bacterium]
MSGGVDSAVCAGLLAEAGFEVVGITLRLYDHGAAVAGKGSCCAGRDIEDARAVADRLGIPHYVLDMERRFREAVIDDFADSYAAGRTPIPCVRCNQSVKFTDLLAVARDLGASALATGHYARRVGGASGAALHAAADPSKDQSYFLFATRQDQLDFSRFPLGDLSKDETRAHAERLSLPVARKAESQDICFVPQGHYSDLVARLRPGAMMPGDIVHVDGRVLGRHEGVIHYTIGQRRGLRIAAGEALHVAAIDHAAHRVIVGPRDAVLATGARLEAANWLAGADVIPAWFACALKLGHNEDLLPGRVDRHADGDAEVTFDEPAFAVAPGQACVAYDGTRLIGGGWITRTASADGIATAA